MEPIEQTESAKSNLLVPGIIILIGLISAGIFYFFSVKKVNPPINIPVVVSLDQMTPVSPADHIRGNPNAPVIIVEYSDTECPYCVSFHKTMKQIMETYGKYGQVAWVYRHSSLNVLHPKARLEAVALECANELGGSDKFWSYTDRIYEITPANNRLDPNELPTIAKYVGLDVDKFNLCLKSTKYDALIQSEIKNAQATGASGTPWSIVVNNGGIKQEINGAYPYNEVKLIIDSLLK